eukprot:8383706-Pyramimonas_sp.AAC.1
MHCTVHSRAHVGIFIQGGINTLESVHHKPHHKPLVSTRLMWHKPRTLVSESPGAVRPPRREMADNA